MDEERDLAETPTETVDNAVTHEHDGVTHDQDGVRHKLRFDIPAAEIAARVSRVTEAFRGRARLAGFRRGKAPLGMVRQQFRDEIRQRVLEEALPERVNAELERLSLEPLESPALDGVDFELDAPLRFTVHFDVAPEIELHEYEGFPATRKETEVDDSMVDNALGEVRDRAARLAPVGEDDTVGEQDFVRAQISLLPRGGKGHRLAEETRFVHVGEEKAIPGLNVQLVGMSCGEDREFVTQLGESYPNAVLAGKEVTCRVTVDEIKRRQLPDIDDALARDLGFDDLQALRDRTAEDLRTSLDRAADRDVERQLLEVLRERNPVDVPPSRVERSLDSAVNRLANELAQQGVDPREGIDWASFRNDNRISATQGVAEEMLLDRVALEEKLEVTDEDLEEEIRRTLELSEGGKSGPTVSVIQQMRKDGSFEAMRATQRRRLALDRLKQHATIDSRRGDGEEESGASSD